MPDPIVPSSEAGPSMPDPASPMPAADGAPAPGPVTFTPDQLDALGLAQCQDGDSYTVKITKTGGDEAGSQFQVESTEPASADGDGTGGDGDGDEGGAPDDSPPLSGMDTPPGDEPNTPPGEGDAEKKILGFARKKKPALSGLPDTKKMRDLY